MEPVEYVCDECGKSVEVRPYTEDEVDLIGDWTDAFSGGEGAVCGPCGRSARLAIIRSDHPLPENARHLWDELDDTQFLLAELDAAKAEGDRLRTKVEGLEKAWKAAAIIAAWLATEISGGRATEALGRGILDVRAMRDLLVSTGMEAAGLEVSGDYVCPMDSWEERALAAEAEVARLREALGKVPQLRALAVRMGMTPVALADEPYAVSNPAFRDVADAMNALEAEIMAALEPQEGGAE